MENSPSNSTVLILWIGLGFLAILLICYTISFLVPLTFARGSKVPPFTFSDFANFLQALISALAFLGIIINLRIQQKALEVQRKGLVSQQEALVSQQEALASQQKVLASQQQELNETKRLMHRQQFESAFFQMLAHLKKTVDELKVGVPIMDDDGGVYTLMKGAEAFDAYDRLIHATEPHTHPRSFDELSSEYYTNAEVVKPFDSYYITLALLLDYIESSGLSEDHKLDYFNLVIQPMTFKQKVALFYHIGINAGRANVYDNTLRRIEKKYRLLENLYRLDRIAPSFDYRFLIDAGIHPETGIHPKPGK